MPLFSRGELPGPGSVFFMDRVDDGKSNNYDICCVSMSSTSSIQMVCRPEFGPALVQSLRTILDSSTINTTVSYRINKKRNPVNVNGWNVYDFKFSTKLWKAPWTDESPECEGCCPTVTRGLAPVARMLISRIMFNFGKEHGWSFMVNGNIKGTTDYLWFICDRNQTEIYQSPVNTDCAYMMPIFKDELQFVNFPTQIIDPLRTLIKSFWGIQDHKVNTDLNCHDFQVWNTTKGCPWKSSGTEAVRSRMLLMKCIKYLLGQGFRPRASLDVSRPTGQYQDMGCIVFFPCDPIPHSDSLIISLTTTHTTTWSKGVELTDHLQLIGNISEIEESCLKSALTQLPHGVTKSQYTNELDSFDNAEKCYSVTFKGNPLSPGNLNEGIHAKVTLQTLINELKESGWSLLISTDLSTNIYITGEGDSKKTHPLDSHSLFLVKTGSQESHGMTFDAPPSHAPPSYDMPHQLW